MSDLFIVIQNIGIALMVALATAIFALSRYRLEKLWDRKLQAYIDIIEAMHHMKRVVSLQMDAEIERREIGEERSKELIDRWKAADMTIRKLADVATLLISDDALECLKKMISGVECAKSPNGLYYEVLDEEYAAINEALLSMTKIAEDDVKRRVWWRLA